MNPDNTIINGPALIYGSAISTTADRAIYTKTPITIRRVTTPTIVGTDHIPNLDQRLNTLVHEVTFTPAGRLDEIEDLLTPAWNKYAGQKVCEKMSVAVNSVATASAGTKISVTLASATVVHVGQYVTLTGMSVSGYNGTWLVSTVTSSTVIVLDVAYSATATGTAKIPKCLVIHPIRQDSDGVKILVYQFAGITAYPDLILSGSETALGPVTVSCIEHPYRSGADAADTVVVHRTWAAPSSTLLELLDAAEMPTLPPRCRYAEPDVNAFTGSDSAAAPWNDFATRDGVRVSTALSTQVDPTDQKGISNWTITAVGVSATCTPVGEDVSEEAVAELLLHQNGVGRGRTLSPDVLEFSALLEDASATYLLRIPRAVPVSAEAAFGSTAPRNGALAFNAVRTLSAGAQVALAAWEVD